MINIYKLELTTLQEEILRLLIIKAGLSMNARRISKYLAVSQPAISKALPNLEKKELVKISQDKESKRWAIELNRDNRKVIQIKRADNIKQIYETGLSDYLEIEFAGATVILFGSYSKGEDTLTSDIDIAVIGRKNKKLDLSKFNRLLEREININFYDSFSVIHKDLKDNILNGIVLTGGVDL